MAMILRRISVSLRRMERVFGITKSGGGRTTPSSMVIITRFAADLPILLDL